MPYLISILLILTASPALALDRYSVTFDDRLEAVSVTACFDGQPPSYLVRHRQSARHTNWIRAGGEAMRNTPGAHRLSLSRLEQGDCVAWQVDLSSASGAGDYRVALRAGDAILTSGRLWFWRDDDRRPIHVVVALPQGMDLSVPWKEQWENGNRVYLPARTPAAWSSRVAVGRFRAQRIAVANTELRLAVIGPFSEERLGLLADWMRDTAAAVASVYGRYPQPEPQILLVAVGAQREAVPWAHVVRGGGIAAEFFIDETRPAGELLSDWTATHELSHMLLPYVSSRDRWLSEGLASYYQNVLRARDGRLTEQEAWSRLHAGFRRGERAASGLSLADAPRSGWRSTMQVYWGGAAILLKADARLRTLDDGRQSLDSALSSLSDCCLADGRAWRAEDLFRALDRSTGHSVFMDLYRKEVEEEEFPELQGTYAELGLDPSFGSLRLDDTAPAAEIRRQIMAAPGRETPRAPSPGSTLPPPP